MRAKELAKRLSYQIACRKEWMLTAAELSSTSGEAKYAVGAFIGRIHMEWFLERKEMGL